MKKNSKFMVTIFLTCILIFSGIIYLLNKEKVSEKFTQVFAFGDSYSDSGQAKKITAQIMASTNRPDDAYLKPSDELYWKGRYSNGSTAVEVLAENLDVPLVNYATGGATTGEKNYSEWMDHLGNTGVLGQIEKFENSLKEGKADPDALYFIFASANDYFLFMDYSLPGTVENVADTAVDNINTAIKRLVTLGAEKFFVVNSSDLSLVPYEITTNRTKSAEDFVKHVNKKLPESIKELQKNSNIKIMMFDLPTISDNIMKNPSKYGLVELDKECQSTYPKVKPASVNPEQYYFWDEWHYTSTVHKILGEKMYDKVKMFK
ncbi:SGNH/GDSL hydrolase family protein [Clostridium gasigenes]|uniref:SGNH/GDSL hydrolase family protein n=1 Tax=Clostridium gasigenes TaxID=94869 RepID=UPI001C0C5E2B|nr:SGNH/GDSL hydrolase family protein [Clostridium gasigenes]MBU3090025.1 SGNH/GDSL hydrolase family protein [Clostridium gasigenes]